jgi:hypothetical protein
MLGQRRQPIITSSSGRAARENRMTLYPWHHLLAAHTERVRAGNPPRRRDGIAHTCMGV